ncbi:C-terminal domain of homeodomain 1-domain-containing protein [Collybia nuda]|uniref:C-terminal domain of homeodomain 1-domain-containing protein n=1 Tax=Collybia nuda TaxID=64659 RepID=A0A9P6CGB0_9AGAR|nr:C-terminal domain of homeodomain 1-domain-containing protein [Collybia nuda]
MMADTDSLISKRLVAVEDDLLEAIVDRPSLAAFDFRWSSLVGDVNEAIAADALSIETMQLAYGLSEKVADVVETFLNLEALSEQIMSSLAIDASSILSSSSNLPTSSSPHSPLSNTFDIPELPTNTSLPPYVEPSCQWLMKNIHNPYPAAHVRNQIAQDTGCPRKDIDGWFIDARKRIGWNALRKSHFSNKRAEIVDAAMRFFIEADSRRPLDPQVTCAFAEIDSCAKSLYSQKLYRSDLAVKLDIAVKDMTPEMKVQAKTEEQCRRSQEKIQIPTIRNISTYPTPVCSPIDPSPCLPLVDEDDLESNVSQSISQPNRKRRATSPDPGISNRSIKRPRIDDPTSPKHSSYELGLPSPAASVHEPLATVCDDSTSETTYSPTSVNGSTRKRRLSDSDNGRTLKRSHIVPDMPNPDSTMAPLSLESSLLDVVQLDDWFRNHANLSSFPNVGANLPTPFEVEFYDFSQHLDQNQVANMFQYPSPMQDYDRLSPVSDIPGTCSFDLDISTNTFNYEELFLSDDHLHKGRAQDTAQIPIVSNVHEGPSAVSFPPDFLNSYGSLPRTADPTCNISTSSPIPDNPATNLDWILSTFNSQTGVQGDKNQNIINLSHMGVFSPLINTALRNDSQAQNPPNQRRVSAQEERAAKQQRLFEIQETARRLEAELAASPC